MRAETIIELVGFVVGPSFTAEATEDMFGPATPTHLPRTLRFAPREPLYGLVEIQTRGGSEPSALSVHFARLITIDIGPLVAAFGEPEERPRMKPDDPIPWRFRVPGGWLLLETTGDSPRTHHEVARVRIRRSPG